MCVGLLISCTGLHYTHKPCSLPLLHAKKGGRGWGGPRGIGALRGEILRSCKCRL